MPRQPQRRWIWFLPCAFAVLLPPSTSRAAADPPQGDKYALLVGVHRYDKNELRDLPYAEADMTALADVLKKAGYKRVVLMTEAGGADDPRFLPTAANVRKTLKGLLGDLSADESILVAFAGHGIQFAGEDDNYFCPMDAKLGDKATLISLTEVYKDLENCNAGTRLLLADCCRNDPRSDNARAVDKVKLESVTRPQRALPPGGVAAFFSCSAGEKAYEDAGIKHGVFFHFIIEGLQGKADADKDGQVDLDELAGYTKKQVRDFVKDTYGDDVRQMPELVGKTHGQVVLARTGGGWTPLFNGKDLAGWKTHTKQPGNWRIENGILSGSGDGVSHLYTDRGNFIDFHLRLEVRLNDGGNSGVYFRAPFGPTLPAANPTWIGAYNAKMDARRFGGLLIDPNPELHRTHEAVLRPGEWITCEIIAEGNHFVIKVNGETTADYTDEQRTFSKGHIVLQKHGAATVAEFRKIEIKDLSPAKDADK